MPFSYYYNFRQEAQPEVENNHHFKDNSLQKLTNKTYPVFESIWKKKKVSWRRVKGINQDLNPGSGPGTFFCGHLDNMHWCMWP